MIHFGTSGWRAIIGEEFTFDNVRRVTQGIAQVLKEDFPQGGEVVVGYDTRFLSDKFAQTTAGILATNGFDVALSKRDVPTPVIAFAIRQRKAIGGINLTASHNPAQYNGLKFSTHDGAPAPIEMTRRIEKAIASITHIPYASQVDEAEHLTLEDLRPDYLERLESLVDVEVFKKPHQHFGVDNLFGTSREYLGYFLIKHGQKVKAIHNYIDPYFGGATPDCKAENLKELRKLVKEKKLYLGLATDGDGDRFGIVDHQGRYIYPNYILALLAWYLTQTRGWKIGLGRTVATTHLVDRVAEKFDIPLYETPVGFKYLGELFLEKKIHFGGEESAGMSILGHVPEKDGILACLLVAEMCIRWNKSLKELKDELFSFTGPLYSHRVDVKLTAKLHEEAPKKMESPPKTLGGIKVIKTQSIDGLKCHLEGGHWVLFRLSGTEPIIRIYAETSDSRLLRVLLKGAKNYIRGKNHDH